jgi:signal transduction histidine kinase
MLESEERLSAADVVTLDRAAVIARLLAGVLHDVNNALLVISGTAEMLEDQPAPPAAVGQSAARIRARTARAAEAISHVMSFARGRPAERGTVYLRDLVDRAVALRTFSAKRAGLNIVFTASADENFSVQGSPVLLLQAVLDLLANAEQALAGRGGGEIRVGLTRDAARVNIRVSDNGPGVPAEHRARIFEPLFTTRSRDEAAGLGLTAARTIAETHGGSLTLEDSESGASFVLSLPV